MCNINNSKFSRQTCAKMSKTKIKLLNVKSVTFGFILNVTTLIIQITSNNIQIIANILGNKSNVYERDWFKFDQENFILDYFSVEWEDLLKIDDLKADNSTKIYLDKINMLLDTYAPLKRINKYKLKFKSKPWITLGLQKSISVKNKLLTNFINKKDPILKEEFHTNYKKYRNLLSTLMKKSKQAYYDKYFERNWNNIKNTWKGIKYLISLKTVASNVPTVLSLDNGDTITNPYDIANTFNNYFASIAETTKKA